MSTNRNANNTRLVSVLHRPVNPRPVSPALLLGLSRLYLLYIKQTLKERRKLCTGTPKRALFWEKPVSEQAAPRFTTTTRTGPS